MVDNCCFFLALSPYCSDESAPFWSKNPTVLHLSFVPLLCVGDLLERLYADLKGSLGLFQVLILVLLWTLTILQGSILAGILCCTEQGESLILLVEGISAFHCGSYPGYEQSFW